jgi:hypothetical protein
MLVWIIVAVIPIALLGSVLGTSRNDPRRRGRAEGGTWWTSEVGQKARPERVPASEDALDG